MSETEPDPDAEARDRRIAELEARLSRPRSVGVLPPVAAVALAGAVALLWGQRADVAYYGSPRQPIDLGAEGAYHFERAVSNRYAQIHGVPTVRGVYWTDRHGDWVAVGVQDTPLLIKRAQLPSEAHPPGGTPPQPDQRPFLVRGRLLSRADAVALEPGAADAFAKHEAFGQLRPEWMLLVGEYPGGDLGAMAWNALLLAFAGLNLWLLLRSSLAWLAARRRG